MKNIHVLPTDKPSRLHYFTANKAGYYLYPNNELVVPRNPNCINQNIYITNSEEIKKGDWVKGNVVGYNDTRIERAIHSELKYKWHKIILTTDQDLIKDGVQAIDDEFLKWFVKNPSCEYVKVTEHLDAGFSYGYKIIIPKEEPKLQCKDCNDNLTDCTCIEDTIDMKQTPGKETADYIDRHVVEAMVEVAKQNLYSEVFQWLASRDYLSDKVDIIQKEFEQFKKK